MRPVAIAFLVATLGVASTLLALLLDFGDGPPALPPAVLAALGLVGGGLALTGLALIGAPEEPERVRVRADHAPFRG